MAGPTAAHRGEQAADQLSALIEELTTEPSAAVNASSNHRRARAGHPAPPGTMAEPTFPFVAPETC